MGDIIQMFPQDNLDLTYAQRQAVYKAFKGGVVIEEVRQIQGETDLILTVNRMGQRGTAAIHKDGTVEIISQLRAYVSPYTVGDISGWDPS
jgi:hypothetical protein